MEYEWDENKRNSNLQKHGFDFIIAPRIYESTEKMTIPSQYKNEQRWVDIALLEKESVVAVMVYTFRNNTVRIISLRKAKTKERRLYHENRKIIKVHNK